MPNMINNNVNKNKTIKEIKKKKNNYQSWTPAQCRYPRGPVRPFGLPIWHSSHLGKKMGSKFITSGKLMHFISLQMQIDISILKLKQAHTQYIDTEL